MRGQAPISSVYRMGDPTVGSCPEQAFAREWKLMRDLWQQRGVVALRPAEAPPELAAALEQWAREAYGKRKAR